MSKPALLNSKPALRKPERRKTKAKFASLGKPKIKTPNEEFDLMVARSKINDEIDKNGKRMNAGLGLFSLDKIEKNCKIIEYIGEKLDREEYLKRYPNEDAGYVVEVNWNTFIDAIDENKSNFGRYSNMCVSRKNKCKNNAKIMVDNKNKKAWLVSTKTIQPMTEIYTDYGPAYRFI